MSFGVNRIPLRTTVLALAILGCVVATANGQTPESDTGKNNVLNVYLWGASIEGGVTYPNGDGSFEVPLDQILDNLKMAGMVTYRRDIDDWSLLLDLIYMDIGNSKQRSVTLPGESGATVDVDADLDLKAWIGGLYAGNTFSSNTTSSHRFIFGVRYFSLSSDLTTYADDPMGTELRSESRSVSEKLWDGVVGFEGQFGLGGKWRLPYHLDIGTGSSKVTYQGLAGFAYELAWGNLSLTYRYLFYDQGDDGLIQELSMDGPTLAVGFRF